MQILYDHMQLICCHCLTCVSSVEPHRATWNKKISSPWGSPITSDKRWNVVRGTTIWDVRRSTPVHDAWKSCTRHARDAFLSMQRTVN